MAFIDNDNIIEVFIHCWVLAKMHSSFFIASHHVYMVFVVVLL